MRWMLAKSSDYQNCKHPTNRKQYHAINIGSNDFTCDTNFVSHSRQQIPVKLDWGHTGCGFNLIFLQIPYSYQIAINLHLLFMEKYVFWLVRIAISISTSCGTHASVKVEPSHLMGTTSLAQLMICGFNETYYVRFSIAFYYVCLCIVVNFILMTMIVFLLYRFVKKNLVKCIPVEFKFFCWTLKKKKINK